MKKVKFYYMHSRQTIGKIATSAYVRKIDLKDEILTIGIVKTGKFYRAFEFESGCNVSTRTTYAKTIKQCAQEALDNCLLQKVKLKSSLTELKNKLPIINKVTN